MPKYVMIVQSKAKPGRDAEYDRWYDTVHLGEILALPGVTSGQRFDLRTSMMGEAGLPCLAIYRIETDDLQGFIAGMSARAATGEMSTSDAVDGPASILRFYEEHVPAAA